MKRISIDDVDAEHLAGGTERRRLLEPLGATGVAVNRYRVPPGAGFPSGLHAHADQEEVFVVLAGEATFETLAGDVTVAAGEAVRFAPGEFQSGRNGAGEDLVALALGAPRDSDDVRVPATCPDCGFGELRLDTGGTGAAGETDGTDESDDNDDGRSAGDGADGDAVDVGLTFACPECGAEHVPAPCPACGSDDLGFTVGDDHEPVVRCGGCGATFDEPPLRE